MPIHDWSRVDPNLFHDFHQTWTIALFEPIAVGETMPDMPAYLDEDHYVLVPLEETYMQSWKSCPEDMQQVVEKGKLPRP